MTGTPESYPYSYFNAFPHSLSIEVNKEILDGMNIMLNDVAEIKKNPKDDFREDLTKYVLLYQNKCDRF